MPVYSCIPSTGLAAAQHLGSAEPRLPKAPGTLGAEENLVLWERGEQVEGFKILQIEAVSKSSSFI